MDQLPADPVPLPLHLPLIGGGLLDLLAFDRAGQEKREGTGGERIRITGLCGQGPIALGRWVEPSHQAMGNQGLIESSAAGDAPGHQTGGDAHAKATAQQLVDQQQLPSRQALPGAHHRGLLRLPLRCRQRGQDLHHPLAQAALATRRRWTRLLLAPQQ